MKSEIKFITLDYMYNHFVHHQFDFFITRHQRPVSKLVLQSSTLSGGRRSIFSLLKIYKEMGKELNGYDGCIVTFHPLIAIAMLLNKVTFRVRKNNKWVHWFTGQVWANSDRGFSLYRLLDLLISKNADLIITDGNGQKKFLISKGFNRRNLVAVVPGTVSGVGFSELSKIKKGNVTNPVIGYVGRISKDKGFPTAVLWAETAGLKLHVYGKLDDISVAKYLSSENVIYHGEVSKICQIYEAIDVLLQPSFREGFSTVIIEAQAAGIPVICRKIYGNIGSIINGKTGFFFDSDTEISCCLNLIVENYFQFSNEAKIFAQSFDREIVLQNVMSIYEKFD